MDLDKAYSYFSDSWTKITKGKYYDEHINQTFEYTIKSIWGTELKERAKQQILKDLPKLFRKLTKLEMPPPYLYILISLQDSDLLQWLERLVVHNFNLNKASEPATFLTINVIDTMDQKNINIRPLINKLLAIIGKGFDLDMIAAFSSMITLNHPEFIEKFVEKFVNLSKQKLPGADALIQNLINTHGKSVILALLKTNETEVINKFLKQLNKKAIKYVSKEKKRTDAIIKRISQSNTIEQIGNEVINFYKNKFTNFEEFEIIEIIRFKIQPLIDGRLENLVIFLQFFATIAFPENLLRPIYNDYLNSSHNLEEKDAIVYMQLEPILSNKEVKKFQRKYLLSMNKLLSNPNKTFFDKDPIINMLLHLFLQSKLLNKDIIETIISLHNPKDLEKTRGNRWSWSEYGSDPSKYTNKETITFKDAQHIIFVMSGPNTYGELVQFLNKSTQEAKNLFRKVLWRQYAWGSNTIMFMLDQNYKPMNINYRPLDLSDSSQIGITHASMENRYDVKEAEELNRWKEIFNELSIVPAIPFVPFVEDAKN